MADNRIQSLVEDSISEATGVNDPTSDVTPINIFSWLVPTGEITPPWWSKARDRELKRLWKTSSHLSTAIYNTQAKIVGIPFNIVPKDTSNNVHFEEAEQIEESLSVSSGLGLGWVNVYSAFVEDLLTQDNGAFMEILGEGEPDGPIVGQPLSVRHLDSFRCTRTSNPIFPVLYTGDDGKLYKFHWTRIIYMSQMPSSSREMNGVGFCAVSRCIEIAHTLADMIRYKQERLGSRPQNQILVGKGITGKTIMTALSRVDQQLSNMGFTRYAKTVAIGSENPEIGLEKIDLNHMEPFAEEISTNLGMFLIAAALGMDADEVWPVSGRSGGGSSGDANLRRMRSRGRLPSQLTSELASQFNFKVLPNHLKMKFDFRDDAEDQQRAIIKDIRGRNRERDLGTGTINIRTARKNMLIDRDLDKSLFEDMEMSDGRMPNGETIGTLFFSEEPVFVQNLRFIPDPLRFVGNITDEAGLISDQLVNSVIDRIQDQRQVVLQRLNTTISSKKKGQLKDSLFALDWLEDKYTFAAGRGLPEVPVAQRRLRTDIRVEPAEDSPEGESAAQASAGASFTDSENISGND